MNPFSSDGAADTDTGPPMLFASCVIATSMSVWGAYAGNRLALLAGTALAIVGTTFKRGSLLLLFLAPFVLVGPARARAQGSTAATVALRLSAQRDTVLTTADLERLPRSRIRVAPSQHAGDTAHRAELVYEGVAVADLLALVGAPLGSAVRGRAVASYVLIEAADGYRVVFSLEEVGAPGTASRVLLADHRDGKPLAPDEGPLRVIAPDARHSRWIRQVVRISVRAAAP